MSAVDNQKSQILRIAVFASGTGSNFKTIVKAIEQGELHAKIAGLISNNPDAGALEFARSRGIPAENINEKLFPRENELETAILNTLESWRANFILLAGYMKKISPEIIKKFNNRILNIHPALLPDFGGKGMYGLNVHEAVIRSGTKVSGVTVHIVNNEYDAGPIVLQRAVPVLEDDTPESLQKRVLKEEHKIYKEAIKLFC
jgi:phosphoribosylglycinamide formyltransferase-1